ncbi:hypothetical protein [Kribbella amoyensis]|uniref:hypothetical protein n=1 Tax=Kribbella amoyensis TaxID=996641 RepID=UPI00192E02CF|nr:hypothetical protein [Kribbella amoyensis]
MDEEQDVGSGVGSPDADVVQPTVDPQCDHAGVVDTVGADPVVDLTGPVRGRAGFRAGVVGGRGGGAVGQ